MQIHRRLIERLTAMLGEPALQGTQHQWQVPFGRHTVNIVLDLPDPLEHLRLWIFDPRRTSLDSVRSFSVSNDQEFDEVLKQVEGIPHPPAIPAR
jgi:hypothetical protein